MTDAKGQELKVGDTVMVPCKITATGGGYSSVPLDGSLLLHTQSPGRSGDNKIWMSGHSRFVVQSVPFSPSRLLWLSSQ